VSVVDAHSAQAAVAAKLQGLWSDNPCRGRARLPLTLNKCHWVSLELYCPDLCVSVGHALLWVDPISAIDLQGCTPPED
jgi:hypothetical protein